MSAPESRLLGDRAAERFELEALAVLSAPLLSSQTESLATGVIALARDRQARIELGGRPMAPMNPSVLLAGVRACIPDGAPIREDELRSHLPEIDEVLAEVKRVNERRGEDERKAP